MAVRPEKFTGFFPQNPDKPAIPVVTIQYLLACSSAGVAQISKMGTGTSANWQRSRVP
jgi:hypothetical protein